jgi:signal transduction histidine kinase
VQVERRDRARQPVTCLDGEIRQVLSNLIGNAIDAMSDERTAPFIRSRESTDWKTGRSGVTLTIADTGSGMSADTISRIFEPFFTTKGNKGTGLGLWISREIVERHRDRSK